MDHSKVSASCEVPWSVGGPATDAARGEAGAGRVPEGGAPRHSRAGKVALTNVHIPPQAVAKGKKTAKRLVRKPVPTASIALGGSLVHLKSGRAGQGGPGGKRGRIPTFSRASRRRLLFLLQSLNKWAIAHLPLFLTLTYPAIWEDDPELWKGHLEAFWKRVQRRFPEASMVWRIEPQKRGAPHYHCLLFGVRFLEKEWVAQAWYEVVASGDEKHLKFGSRVEQVKSWRGVMAYASKYVAKLPDESIKFTYVGRWWGVKGGKYLPVDWFSEALSFPQFHFMRRVIRRYLRAAGVRVRSGRYAGASAFLPSEVAFRLLDYLTQERVT